MKVLLYRDDGLGDTLFTIPTLNILSKFYEVHFYTKHSHIFNKIRISDKLKILHQIENVNYDVAIFLGPWGRIKNAEHLYRIIQAKANKKFISSYRSKMIFRVLKLLGIFFKINVIDFEDIFVGHDILNTFNFVSFALSLGQFDLNKVLDLFNYELYFKNCECSRDLILVHFTYKSIDLGISVRDYCEIISFLGGLGQVLVVFGPYERRYWEYLSDRSFFSSSGGVKKIMLNNIEDYFNLCLRARVMVGFDTGPVHLAAFCNVPFVVSFFPDSGFEYRVTRWKPFSCFSKVNCLRYSELKRIREIDLG
ncbi:MAG: hypothetical protein ABDH21_06685 [bacterium]